jgi:NTE family protein
VKMLISIFMIVMSREYVHDQYWKKIIIVNTGKLVLVDFNMSIRDEERLYAIGYRTALEFTAKRLNIVNMSITEFTLKFTDLKE